jgi:hypothetical protein
MDFPKDTQADLDAFYSKHKLGPDGTPTAAWKKEHFTTITPAYPGISSWNAGDQSYLSQESGREPSASVPKNSGQLWFD